MGKGLFVFKTNGAGKTGYPHEKKRKLDPNLTPHNKINSKCIKYQS